MKILFATNNSHKLSEIKDILGERIQLLSLKDINCHEEIPEDHDTIQENALQKAEYILNHYDGQLFDYCMADDTALEVDALNGEPGVHSARYAEGSDHDSEANMRKLLAKLGNNNNRRARFRTVIALVNRKNDDNTHSEQQNTEIHYFEGIVEGNIIHDKRGKEGFGYDPIFIPDGYDLTFAELGNEVKNKISHRARAIEQLYRFLQTLIEP